jgi:arabinogalactan endo-1,4-beta-galactosidase
MKNGLIIFVFSFVCGACNKNNNSTPSPNPPSPVNVTFIRGLDLSFTPEINAYNIGYNNNGTVKPILDLVKEKGINTIRVRLWYNPVATYSSLPEVIAFAQQVKNKNLAFCLDLHYSDTWADPGTQTKPAAWAGTNASQLKDSVYNYTKRVLQQLSLVNSLPDYIQLGNEINSGFLWNDGKVNNLNDPNWTNFADLLKQGVRAVREISASTKIIIHYAGLSGTQGFFDKLVSTQVDFDIAGISYYPWWHGFDMNVLQQTILAIRSSAGKQVVVAETAYPFTLGWSDQTNNSVGLSSQLIPAYDATPAGQAAYISHLIDISRSISSNSISGVCYWAPDWVAYKGPASTSGSSWENLALFNFQFSSLAALDSLGKH